MDPKEWVYDVRDFYGRREEVEILILKLQLVFQFLPGKTSKTATAISLPSKMGNKVYKRIQN